MANLLDHISISIEHCFVYPDPPYVPWNLFLVIESRPLSNTSRAELDNFSAVWHENSMTQWINSAHSILDLADLETWVSLTNCSE